MSSSRKVVYAGIATNVTITITKLVVALASGSSSMLAEFFHSGVDTGNSVLLLFGMYRSRRPAHARHPFGHGKELYFWSFVVAVSMFTTGGVLSIWEGISRMRKHEALSDPKWSYIVLAVSAAVSTISLVISLREVYRRKGDAGIIQFIRQSKDPTVFTVALEDAGDIIGELIALLAIFLSVKLHNPVFDGCGSIAIGAVILVVSGFLANESRDLLIGEMAPADQVQRMKELLQTDEAVERVGELLTMQLGPKSILVNVEIQFQRNACVEDLEDAIARLEHRLRNEFPQVEHLFVEVAALHRRHERLRKAS